MIERPPIWADRFLEWFCNPELLEDLQGDFYEIFRSHIDKGHTLKAQLVYIWLVLRSLRPSVITRNKKNRYTPFMMTSNNFRIAFRIMVRNRFNTILNLSGLAIGIACFLLIGFFAKQELTYDFFHSKKDRIYRVWLKEVYSEDQIFFNSITPLRFEKLLEDNFDEVETAVQFDRFNFLVGEGEERYNEPIGIISPEFFDVFDFKITDGNVAKPLPDENSIIISESYARKYFGTNDPIGKFMSVQVGDEIREFRVTALFEDIGKGSSITFNMAISNENNRTIRSEGAREAWFSVSAETYVLIDENSSIESVRQKIPDVVMSYLEGRVEPGVYNIGFQPLTDIHLNTEIPLGLAPVGNPVYVYVLISISLLVLIIACINYATLTIGQSLKRSREVGVRKVMGALKGTLISQYLTESIVVALLATVLGIGLTYLVLPGFNSLTGADVSLSFESWHLILYGTIAVAIGFFSGLYPAFILSRMNTTSILKGNTPGHSRHYIRKGMVVFQFVITVFLISSTLIMKRQLNYIYSKDLGYNYKTVVSVPLYADPSSQRLGEYIYSAMEKGDLLKEKLNAYPEIDKIGMGSHVFGTPGWGNLAYTDENGTFRRFNFLVVDPGYFETFDIKMIQGRAFELNNGLDKRHSIVINEAARKYFGLEYGVGEKLPGEDFGDHMIIGVTEDFNYSSLHSKVEPLVITENIEPIYKGISDHEYEDSPIPKLVFRYSGSSLLGVKDILEKEWKNTFPEEELNFSFVEENIQVQYAEEEQMNQMLSVSTVLSMIIASLGLLGLTVLVVNSREKEIGIRKVNGASEIRIFSLLARSFSMQLILGIILSIPLTYWIMSQWLNEFAFRISLGVENFIVSGFVALIIALVVISYHTIKASRVNPVKSLRNE